MQCLILKHYSRVRKFIPWDGWAASSAEKEQQSQKSKKYNMKQILILGMNPHTIDFSQPGFLPHLTAEKVLMGLHAERESLKAAGCDSDMYLMDTGVCDMAPLVEKLRAKRFDGVMVGAGVRIPPSNFILFEKLINTVHEKAPHTKIIFNTNPHDTAESLDRWL